MVEIKKEKPLKDIWSLLLFFLQVAVIAGIFPLLMLFAFGAIGLSEALNKFLTEWIILIIGVLIITSGKVAQYIRRITKREKHGWFNVLLNDPEEGLVTKKFKWLGKLRNAIPTYFFIFILLGVFFGVATQTFFVELPVVLEQVTETGEIGLAVEPASFSETILFFAIYGLFFFIWKYLVKRNKWGKLAFWAGVLFLIPFLVMGPLGIAFHYARYAGSEISLFIVYIFWSFGTLLCGLTGSFYAFWIWHFTNNLFEKLTRMYPANIEGIITTTIVLLFFAGMIYFFIYLKWFRKKKNKEGD